MIEKEELNTKRTKFGIAVKISLICSAVVLIFLFISNFIFLRLESDLVRSIIDDNVVATEKSIEEEGIAQRKELDDRITANTKICATISSYFLYNIDSAGLKLTLQPYMDLSEVQAIEVLDYRDEPFFAFWRDQGIKSGTKIPTGIVVNELLSDSQESIYQEEKVGTVTIYMTDALLLGRLNQNKENAKTQVSSFRMKTDNKLTKVKLTQVIVVFGVILILIAAIMLSLKVIAIRPIKNVIERIKDIAEGEGDLTSRLEVENQDEVGELAQWFNTFIDRLQNMVRNISSNAETLNQASSELSNLSGQMSEGADQMSAKANSVASASEEMSTNMDSVAHAMAEASTNISMVSISAEEMTSTINEIAGNSEKARNITGESVEKAQGVSVKVDELGRAAQEIGKVTEAISEISEQTNLLALNATIEAARAGEAGKGFAVVANEIKELARQTAEATQEIKGQIEGIQNSATGTVSEIEEILKVINDVNEIVSTIATAVEEQSVTTREIASNVAQASDVIQETNDNVSQSSEVSGEIAREITDVNQSAADMTNSSAQVNLSAQELKNLAEQLKEMVNKFKV